MTRTTHTLELVFRHPFVRCDICYNDKCAFLKCLCSVDICYSCRTNFRNTCPYCRTNIAYPFCLEERYCLETRWYGMKLRAEGNPIWTLLYALGHLIECLGVVLLMLLCVPIVVVVKIIVPLLYLIVTHPIRIISSVLQ